MKRTFGVMASFVLAASTMASEAPWDDQLREMGHWILQISAINAINGLNLSREQAMELRALSKQIEAAGIRPPAMRGKLYGDFNEVRKTYQELREVLLKGGETPKELEARVADARRKESTIIRASLTAPSDPNAKGECSRCHAPPEKFEAAKESGEMLDIPLNRPEMFPNPDAGRKSTDWAHMSGELGGVKGILTMSRLAPKVEGLLSDAQREIVDKFACCLIPPQALSDPVRAGQADVSAKELELLRKVRTVPAATWPRTKDVWVNFISKLEDFKQPGRSEAQVQAGRQRVAAVFEKVRAASDTEFEMNKETFCTELKGGAKKEVPDRARRFKFAYFLLNPSSEDIYDAILKRMDAQRK